MSGDIKAAKEALRQEIKAKGRQVTPAERMEASLAISARLKASDLWAHSQVIQFFSALPGEPDMQALLAEGIATGKTITLPRYNIDHEAYTPAQIEDISRDCIQGKYGILEPSASCRSVSLKQLDLMLVPGLCFDVSGRRLGRGKGFYDRMLAQVRGIKCGLAFDWQMVSGGIPTEPHDTRLNCILTPTRWHWL